MIIFKTGFSLTRFTIPFIFILAGFIVSCNDAPPADVTEQEIVQTPEAINAKARDIIRGTLENITEHKHDLPDSIQIGNASIVQHIYDEYEFEPLWSVNGTFKTESDSLLQFISISKQYALFPDDYYYSRLVNIGNRLLDDSVAALDASLWAYRDLLMTSAFVQAIRDLKVGRLVHDSIIAADTSMTAGFYLNHLQQFKEQPGVHYMARFEPANTDYHKIKKALKNFLDSADLRTYTYVLDSAKDSLQLRRLTYQRLAEEDSLHLPVVDNPDSLQVALAVRKYQKYHKLKVDGKISSSLVSRLNNTGREKFIRVAINMDRYKQLPALPKQYLWVNMPGYYLQMRDSDTVVLRSKIVVGKPKTRTPVITSAISNMITYPQWHIPESIIKTEILPGLKRDPEYTRKKGYSILDKDGNEVDPLTVDWKKYKKGIPYRVIQGSGDDNALGVLKFNFPNTHAVYLHDTNQRYLFSRSNRALSHGCVRVQSWKELAKYILINDSIHGRNATPVDSLNTWLSQKQKKYVPVRKPIPLFIRYFTIDAEEEKLVFYEDIYGEDRKHRPRFVTR